MSERSLCGMKARGMCGRFEIFESARHFRIEFESGRPIRIRFESRSFAGPYLRCDQLSGHWVTFTFKQSKTLREFDRNAAEHLTKFIVCEMTPASGTKSGKNSRTEGLGSKAEYHTPLFSFPPPYPLFPPLSRPFCLPIPLSNPPLLFPSPRVLTPSLFSLPFLPPL